MTKIIYIITAVFMLPVLIGSVYSVFYTKSLEKSFEVYKETYPSWMLFPKTLKNFILVGKIATIFFVAGGVLFLIYSIFLL